MDVEDIEDIPDVQPTILDPASRLKVITSQANEVEIDNNIPPRRYFRSGLEMVRMANVYMDEGSLENAFILYLRFMTLFLQKIREHPDFNTVSKTDRDINHQKLREVLPKAEELKKKLLAHYTKEYERFLRDQKRREAMLLDKMKVAEEEKKKSSSPSPPPKSAAQPKLHITPVPPLLDNLTYPNSDGFTLNLTKPTTIIDKSDTKMRPEINRSSKPSILLSPTVAQSRLRVVIVPGNLVNQFLVLARRNTDKNNETCAILAGKLKREQLVVTHLLVPEQIGSRDSCTALKEEDLFDYQDQHDLITFGWIHTHPTQTAFMSSVDLHTHYAYQRMIPEAIAIVCAPQYFENSFFCLTDYGLNFIGKCTRTGFHPHPTQPEICMVAEHYKLDPKASLEVVDLRQNKV